MFITLEGIDGCGKSTQLDRLRGRIEDAQRDVVVTHDPGGTPTGDALRRLLLDSDLTMHRRTEAMLFMAARGEMVERVIRPALARGSVVLSDRYLLSNIAYQSVAGGIDGEIDGGNEGGNAGGVSAAEILKHGRWAAGGVVPDLTVLLDIPVRVSLDRRRGQADDRMERRGEDYLDAVRVAYRDHVGDAAGRSVVIDADAPTEWVADRVWEEVRGRV